MTVTMHPQVPQTPRPGLQDDAELRPMPVASPYQQSWNYFAWGICIRSELPLPELPPENHGIAPDVEIAWGAVQENLERPLGRGVRFQMTPGALLLRVDGVARYLAEGGRRVTIAREAAAGDDEVRLFLLGTVFGALLEQRGDLVLRGSVVEFAEHAVVFAGSSGAGKSTLAALLHRRGHRLLTDEIAVLRPAADGRLHAHPGAAQINLWPDSLAHLGLAPGDWPRLRPALEKRAVRVAQGLADTPRAVRAVCLLAPWNRAEFHVEPVVGAARIETLRPQVWRSQFDAPPQADAAQFQALLHLARQARCSVLHRPAAAFRLEELAAAVEAEASA